MATFVGDVIVNKPLGGFFAQNKLNSIAKKRDSVLVWLRASTMHSDIDYQNNIQKILSNVCNI